MYIWTTCDDRIANPTKNAVKRVFFFFGRGGHAAFGPKQCSDKKVLTPDKITFSWGC